MNTVITAEQAFTPAGIVHNARVVIEDGRIAAVGSRDALEIPPGAVEVDFGANILVPGFIDIHIHGGAGYDVMQASADELAAMERALAARGVTSYFPTTVTAPVEDTCVALERLAAAIETADTRIAREPGLRGQPLGGHLEGPFLSYS